MTAVPWADLEPLQVQQLLSALLVRTVDGAYAVDGAGGDDGADVVAPVAGGIHVYEIKSFAKRLSTKQRSQVEKSLSVARKQRTAMVAWTLVLPLDPSPAEERWLAGTLAPLAGVPVSWMGRTQVEASFAERPDLARPFLPGSGQQQALEWLSNLHHEEAGLAGGVPDAVARGRRLRQQMGLVDPDYDFDLGLQADQTTIAVRPKDAGSAERRPIAGALRLTAAVGSPEADAIKDFQLFGAPLTLTGNNIAEISIDLPGGLPALVDGAVPTGLTIGSGSSEPRRARLVASPPGGELRLPVTIIESTRGPSGGMRLVAVDDPRTLSVEMRVLPDGRFGEFCFSLTASGAAFPSDALPGARFIAALKETDALRIEVAGMPPATVRLPTTAGVERVSHLVAMLEALERVQHATGVAFPVPARLSLPERHWLFFLDGLVTHGEVSWWWPGFVVTMSARTVREQVLSSAVLPRLTVNGSGNKPVLIAGHTLELRGTVVMTATDVLVSNPLALARQVAAPGCADDAPLTVELEADERTKVLFRLEQ